MKTWLMGLAALGMSTPALASSWIRVAAGNSGGTYFYDADTLVRGGRAATVWLKVEHPSAKSRITEIKLLKQFDCAARLSSNDAFVIYYADGHSEAVAKSELIRDEPIAPDTVMEAVYQIACGK